MIARMNRTLASAALATALLTGLTACGNGTSNSGSSSSQKPSATASKPLTADTAFASISGKVSSAKLSGTVTAENDPNHLLGRPNQYTSKVTFTDGRIKAADVTGTEKGDVERGGAIEVFGSPADAAARAKYIQAVTKAMPALTEYDYVNGTIVIRVSHYLTPTQAASYKTAATRLS